MIRLSKQQQERLGAIAFATVAIIAGLGISLSWPSKPNLTALGKTRAPC